jgi:hypothetical protein
MTQLGWGKVFLPPSAADLDGDWEIEIEHFANTYVTEPTYTLVLFVCIGYEQGKSNLLCINRHYIYFAWSAWLRLKGT